MCLALAYGEDCPRLSRSALYMAGARPLGVSWSPWRSVFLPLPSTSQLPGAGLSEGLVPCPWSSYEWSRLGGSPSTLLPPAVAPTAIASFLISWPRGGGCPAHGLRTAVRMHSSEG